MKKIDLNISHNRFMKLALKEAEKGIGLVSPNPLVGALLVKEDKVIETAFHGEQAKWHAERVLFDKLNKKQKFKSQIEKNNFLRKAILYVTLEPCCHYGKTPPCVDLIIKSGIKKVVIAQIDPNPLVQGRGVRALKQVGIEVITKVLEKEASEQIRFFNFWVLEKKPYFFAKLALSTDGFYGKKGQRIQISTLETKKHTDEMRSGFDAIMIGKKTLLTDNPYLGSNKKDPFRIIFCNKADFSVKKLQCFRDNNVLIACREKTKKCDFKGVFLYYHNFIDFKKQLYEKGIQSLLLEGGGDLINSFLKKEEINEFLLVQSKQKVLQKGLKINVQVELKKYFLLKRQKKLRGDNLFFYQKN